MKNFGTSRSLYMPTQIPDCNANSKPKHSTYIYSTVVRAFSRTPSQAARCIVHGPCIDAAPFLNRPSPSLRVPIYQQELVLPRLSGNIGKRIKKGTERSGINLFPISFVYSVSAPQILARSALEWMRLTSPETSFTKWRKD